MYSTAEAATPQEEEESEVDLSVTNLSLTEHYVSGTSVMKKFLHLQVRLASYSMQADDRRDQPLYECTTDWSPGDSLTQVLVSLHSVNQRSQSPRTLLTSYNITSNNLTLN
jgi:hypothetical protein